ncbi:universal stress protein [Martelella sp. HB161492]|uniref:universal stress protein n=1 Tax=Martelella sp. HB161492 TaxID=2720726 RepID=UPI0015909828|nr:universal stress protein [Martelella sp. HB161492]
MSSIERPSPHIIVALLPAPETVSACLDCARAAAVPFDARISAIHIGFDAAAAFATPEEVDIQQLRALEEGSAQERRKAVKAALDSWAEDIGSAPAVTWKDDEGNVGVLVAEETRRADLVVMANPATLDGRDAFHSVLFRSRRLLLVAPSSASPRHTVVGRNIVVGWKPGAPVERAAENALPWLAKADKISVVCVETAGRRGYADNARNWFDKAGLRADITTVTKGDGSVGQQLLAEAERLGSDSLLIGAFKHGELWEAILGGVTRDVLAAAQLPVFMMC